MGTRICALARDDERFEIVARIDRRSPAPAPAEADAIVDFSSDEGTRDAVGIAVEQGAALLVGTTGLSRQTLSALEVAAQSVAVLAAPNTSRGIAVLDHLAAEAARLLGDRATVDVIEVHHAGKRDSPSGTALRIAETLRRAGVELPPERIHAIRTGDVVGEHTVEFAAAGERIRLCHLATSRDLFVRGALDAVAWLADRPAGRYTIEQAMGL